MSRQAREFLAYFAVLAVLCTIAYALVKFGTYRVDKQYDLMAPAIKPNTHAWTDRKKTALADLACGDIIAYRNVSEDKFRTLFGRIVGKPGDLISISKGKISRNGKAVDESGIRLLGQTELECYKVRVPRYHVFVMLDDRGRRQDKLETAFVHGRLIKGRVFD